MATVCCVYFLMMLREMLLIYWTFNTTDLAILTTLFCLLFLVRYITLRVSLFFCSCLVDGPSCRPVLVVDYFSLPDIDATKLGDSHERRSIKPTAFPSDRASPTLTSHTRLRLRRHSQRDPLLISRWPPSCHETPICRIVTLVP